MAGKGRSPASRAYDVVKRRILNQTYLPGDKLSEVRLAHDLGLGRSPVRTALTQLTRDGWLSVSPKSGTYVRSLSNNEIRDLLDLRLLLETHVAGDAAANIGDAKLRELRSALDAVCPNGARELDAAAIAKFNEVDSFFHATIYHATGNRLVTEILLNLVDKVKWIKMSAPMSADRMRRSFVEVEIILKALEARDKRAAARSMHQHIRNAAEYAVEARAQWLSRGHKGGCEK